MVMNSFAQALKRKLTSLIGEMSVSKCLFVRFPKKDFTRKRKLPFGDIITTIIAMGGNNINKELLDAYDYDANTATSSAFIQQRDKIKPLAFEHLFRAFTASFEHLALYKGFRLLAIDGSDMHTPTNPNDTQTHIKFRPTDKGYNVFHLTALYDLLGRFYVDAILTKRNTGAIRENPDIYSYLPGHTPFDFLDEHNPFFPITLRVVRFKLADGSYQALVTNLLADAFTADEIKTIYALRWGIETSFRKLKHTIGLNHFHSKLVHQVNFTAATLVCRPFLRIRGSISPLDVEALILKNTVPIRPGRKFPCKPRFSSAVCFAYWVA